MMQNSAHSAQCQGHNGQHVRVEASQEIILTGGAINTPRLLMVNWNIIIIIIILLIIIFWNIVVWNWKIVGFR